MQVQFFITLRSPWRLATVLSGQLCSCLGSRAGEMQAGHQQYFKSFMSSFSIQRQKTCNALALSQDVAMSYTSTVEMTGRELEYGLLAASILRSG